MNETNTTITITYNDVKALESPFIENFLKKHKLEGKIGKIKDINRNRIIFFRK